MREKRALFGRAGYGEEGGGSFMRRGEAWGEKGGRL